MIATFSWVAARWLTVAETLRKHERYVAFAPAALAISLVPVEERSTRVSLKQPLRAAGLLFRSKPNGISPPTSPTRRALPKVTAFRCAACRLGTGKQRHPLAAAVINEVVARITSTHTMAWSSTYFSALSGKQSIFTLFMRPPGTAL